MLTQDDFYDKAKNFALFKDCDGKYFTFEEYQQLIKDNQTDKDGNLIYLYAQNKEAQYSYIEAAKNKGYSVLLLDGQLDTPIVSMLERKFEKSRFTRVDADIIDRLIVKEDANKSELDAEKSANLSAIFNFQMPKLDKTEFHVEAQGMGENSMPVMITQSEYMRRMKDMAHIQPGMSFYGEMPDMYTLVLNTDHRLIKEVLADSETHTAEQLNPSKPNSKGCMPARPYSISSRRAKSPKRSTRHKRMNWTNAIRTSVRKNKRKTTYWPVMARTTRRCISLSTWHCCKTVC